MDTGNSISPYPQNPNILRMISEAEIIERMRGMRCMDLGGDGNELSSPEALFLQLTTTTAPASVAPPAVWSVSTAKHGNGVINILNWKNFNTYWQSDGVLPHHIRVDFATLAAVEAVLLLLSHQSDESYTPYTVAIRTGTCEEDMMEVGRGIFENPEGWGCIDIGDEDDEDVTVITEAMGFPPSSSHLGAVIPRTKRNSISRSPRVWCTRLEIIILENRENGRDCRVRGVRILGPCQEPTYAPPKLTRDLFLR